MAVWLHKNLREVFFMMKKMVTFLLAIALMCTGMTAFASEENTEASNEASTETFAAKGDWWVDGKPGWDYDWNLDGNAQPSRRDPSSKTAMFYLQLDGLQMDTSGNIASHPKTLFTDMIKKSDLVDKTRDANYTVVAGGDVTSDDVIAEVVNPPETDEAFDAVRDQLMYKGYIRSHKGEVIPWACLNTKYYGIEWYVFKLENDGWHIDGRILDLETNDIIDIVIPDKPTDIPEDAYKPDDTKPDDKTDEDKDDNNKDEETKDTSIVLDGAKYAYIFGYEPLITTTVDENGTERTAAQIKMGMDDDVTVEQVSSMLMRLLDQELYTKGKAYKITPSIEDYRGEWFARGLAYQCEVGGLDSDNKVQLGKIKRGLVAKLVSCALKLNLSSDEVPFTDVEGNEYVEYIKKVYAYGYMEGIGNDRFAPDEIMTRAEFCALFNKIIGRDKMGLTAIDENGNEFEVTAEDYNFIDMNPSHWGYEGCLKATSAYDDNGFISFSKRQQNIRNILDDFDSQLIY